MARLLPVFIALLLAVAGCSIMPSWAGGDGARHVLLDEDYETNESVYVGQSLVVRVHRPRSAGYALSGASFDPSMLRLDSVLADPDDPEVTVYVFLAMEPGETILTLRASKDGGEPESYRVVNLRIEK